MAMYDSSEDMITLVGQIGLKVATVFPKMQKRGIIISPSMAKQIHAGVEAHTRVRERYEAGHFRHSSQELKLIGELAQFLINMHSEMNNQDRIKKGMVPEPVPQLTIEERRMVKRKVTYG